MTFHAGERDVQRRAGVERMAEKIGRSIHDFIPEAAADFLEAQPMAVLASRDGAGRVRASLLAGRPGFVRVVDPRTVDVAAPVAPRGPVGLLSIDLATRKRMRLNGTAEPGPGGFRIHATEAYSNCPKYIQRRILEGEAPGPPGRAVASSGLAAEQEAFIAKSDTFCIATAPPGANADASQRGGQPGFVRIVGKNRLAWDDYPGNTMFNTLGNLVLNPDAALLFVDFEGGRTLELTGRARVIGDEPRVVEFDVDGAVDNPAGSPLRWRFVDYSPFNPR
jgi:uncharacterized protein